ncbi:MAG: hypothetical protein II054_00305, partial [Treponema sp.]|nr:hypothetical protein [Treponema sp.]
EERIAELNETRNEISGTEERLTKLAEQADHQIDVLHDIAKKDVQGKKGGEGSKSKKKSASASLTPQIRDRVRALKKRYNWTNQEIAENCGISESEVELILELPGEEN